MVRGQRSGSGNEGQDEAWQFCTRVQPGNHINVQCNYCKKKISGGIYRMKHHLGKTKKDVAACDKCPESVTQKCLELIGHNLDTKRRKGEVQIQTGRLDYYFDDQDPMGDEGKGKGPMEKLMGHNLDTKRRKKEAQMQTRRSDYYFDDQDPMGDEGKGKGPMGNFVNIDDDKKQATLNRVWKKEGRTNICRNICRFFYANGLPFNLVKSPFFQPMCESIARFGIGFKPPSYHEIRNTYLKIEVENVKKMLEKHKKEWAKKGCTIMIDGWTDGKNRSITNFLVNSPMGSVFLRTVDTSSISKNEENLADLIDSVIVEVGVENVVQIVTDNIEPYVMAGKKLMERRKKLFWAPCAAHCLDLMLEDLGKRKLESSTISDAKAITKFIYSHGLLLNLMRTFTKNRELVRPAITRFATCYLTLKNILKCRTGLRRMFCSEEWDIMPLSKTEEGIKVHDLIFDSKFWKRVEFCAKVGMPLVKLLRLVDGDNKSAMGYIYEGMDRAKEKIAKRLNNDEKKYMPYWNLIDVRWNEQLHHPLHAAAYYLNPSFHYDESFCPDIEIKRGLYQCLDKLAIDMDDRIKIDEQLLAFRTEKGFFGDKMAIATRKRKQPAIWWEDYGDETKELQRIAIRILSLTCSATGCERNWSVFEQFHTKRRNRLEAKRMNALVFVKYNLQLQVRQTLRDSKEDYDPICLSDVESDDEWITEKEDPTLSQDNSWLEADEMFNEEENNPRKEMRVYSRKRKSVKEEEESVE